MMNVKHRWHRALVDKMALDIPGLRPPLLADRQTVQDALTLLKFRHRIRNLNERERAVIAERSALARAEAQRLALAIGRADPRVRTVRLTLILTSIWPWKAAMYTSPWKR